MLDLEVKSSNDPRLLLPFSTNGTLSIILHVRAKNRRVSVRHTYSTCLAAVGRHKNLLFGREKSLSDQLYNISRERLVCVYLYSNRLLYR